MTNVEQLIREMSMLDSYLTIFMLRKGNDVSLVCLILGLEIPSAKAVENEVALFWSKEEVEVDDHLIYLTSYTCLIDYDVGHVVRANITTRDRFALWLATFNKNDDIRMSREPLGPASVLMGIVDVFKKRYILQGDVDA